MPLLVRRKKRPDEQLEFIIAAGPVTEPVDKPEKQVSHRPVHHFIEAAGILSGHLAHDQTEVAEVHGAALAVGLPFACRFEDFGELCADFSPS